MASEVDINGGSVREIAASIEQAIRQNELKPGDALPSVRELAGRLSVSPATVASAYRILRDRAFIVTDGRRGSRVSERPALGVRLPVAIPENVTDLAGGNPDPALLPSLSDALNRLEFPQRLYGEASVDPDLLEAVREDVLPIGPPPDEALVVSGGLDGIERILQVHLRPGDAVAVEDPCYLGLLDLVRTMGMICQPVQTDARGMLPDSLRWALRSGASAVVVTPRAQNPTGSAVDAARAADLTAVLARHPDPLVIESDHVGRISSAPRVTTIHERSRWALVRSMNKSLGPDLRVGVVFGDAITIARMQGRQSVGPGWVSHILQRLTVALWRDPEVAALVSSAADAYRLRREALLGALSGHDIAAIGRTGFNVWIPVEEESVVAQALLERGWAVRVGAPYRLESPPGLRVTTSCLDPEDGRRFADDLAAVLGTTQSLRLA